MYFRRAGEEDNSNKVNSEISVIEIINEEKKGLPNEQDSTSYDKETVDKKTREYSFDESVYILNFFNFFVFLILTCVLTIIFMIILMI